MLCSAVGADNVQRNISGVGQITNGLCQPVGLGVQLPAEGGLDAYIRHYITNTYFVCDLS